MLLIMMLMLHINVIVLYKIVNIIYNNVSVIYNNVNNVYVLREVECKLEAAEQDETQEQEEILSDLTVMRDMVSFNKTPEDVKSIVKNLPPGTCAGKGK